MSTKKAQKQIQDFETFQKVFVEAEQVMKKNYVKLIESKLKVETNFDARMAYKICIKLIETGTLNDVISLDATDTNEALDGDKGESQSKGSDL